MTVWRMRLVVIIISDKLINTDEITQYDMDTELILFFLWSMKIYEADKEIGTV